MRASSTDLTVWSPDGAVRCYPARRSTPLHADHGILAAVASDAEGLRIIDFRRGEPTVRTFSLQARLAAATFAGDDAGNWVIGTEDARLLASAEGGFAALGCPAP